MSEAVKVKVGELKSAALDWAVGKAIDAHVLIVDGGEVMVSLTPGSGEPWHPSRSWSQCEPLIDKYRYDVDVVYSSWVLADDGPLPGFCRGLVEYVFGDEIEIPAELVK